MDTDWTIHWSTVSIDDDKNWTEKSKRNRNRCATFYRIAMSDDVNWINIMIVATNTHTHSKHKICILLHLNRDTKYTIWKKKKNVFVTAAKCCAHFIWIAKMCKCTKTSMMRRTFYIATEYRILLKHIHIRTERSTQRVQINIFWLQMFHCLFTFSYLSISIYMDYSTYIAFHTFQV